MKSFQQFVNEDWLTQVKNPGFGSEYRVYDNPTVKDLAEIQKNSGLPDIRFLVDTQTNKVYAFPSALIHSAVIKHLNLDMKKTYKGIGVIKNGKIWVGINREPYSVILNNPKISYASLYYDDPQLAFEALKKNCAYFKYPLFNEDSIDQCLKQELKIAERMGHL